MVQKTTEMEENKLVIDEEMQKLNELQEEIFRKRELNRLRVEKCRKRKAKTIENEQKIKKPRNTKMTKFVEENKNEDSQLMTVWNNLKNTNDKNVYHAIIGYTNKEQLEKQDKYLEQFDIYMGPGCFCKDTSKKKNSCHLHRHILMRIDDDMLQDAIKNRHLHRNKGFKEVIPDSRFKLLTCQFHLKNVLHYVSCSKSADTRDRVNGGWSKGTHVHGNYFNKVECLMHNTKQCSCIQTKIERVCQPQHDYKLCECPRGFYKTSTHMFIRTLPKEEHGSNAYIKMCQKIRYYKKLCRASLGMRRQDSIDDGEPFNKPYMLDSDDRFYVEQYFYNIYKTLD